MNIGMNKVNVPEDTLQVVMQRTAYSVSPTEIAKYFENPVARRNFKEFEVMYSFCIKEFIYFALINDFDSSLLV